jgi:Rrf2 family nitric oxide-sensitive transcriptional repressor
MLFSLSTQIALQASILLSADPQIPLRTQDMAATLGVTPSHLNRVLHELRQNGLVRMVRGPCGGMVLARSPKLISVWEVLVAMEPVEAWRTVCSAFAVAARRPLCTA